MLIEGERLSRGDFLARWEAMPRLKRAELIDGKVRLPSPVSRRHGDYHLPISAWLGIYVAATKGCWAGIDSTWLMGGDCPQPDLALRILPEYGGQCRNEGIYLAGAPELVVEIAASSQARDLGPKRKLYARSGVREYLTVPAGESSLLWQELDGSAWRRIDRDGDGVYRSRVFPGLWLDPDALLSGDLEQVLSVLRRGLDTRNTRSSSPISLRA